MVYPNTLEKCNKFSDYVKYYMKSKKIKQKELADRLNLSEAKEMAYRQHWSDCPGAKNK